MQSKFISPFQSSAGSEQIHITISNKHKCTASHVTIGVEPIHFARSNKRGCRAQSFHFWFRATSFHHLDKHWRWASSATYGAEHHHSTVYISVGAGQQLPPLVQGNNCHQLHKRWRRATTDALGNNCQPIVFSFRAHFNQALARTNSYHHFNQALVQSKFISTCQSGAGAGQIHVIILIKCWCRANSCHHFNQAQV